MVGHNAECRSRGVAVRVATLVVALLLSGNALAYEAFDGRIQAHGFAEAQIRTLDEKFSQQLDLAQWYNVLNLEFEFDILPDGWGPIDLLGAYVRVEARYDCVWERGCGMFRSVNTYGDDAQRLPDRLSDGEVEDYGGVIEVGPRDPSNPKNRVLSLNDERVDIDPALLPLNSTGEIADGFKEPGEPVENRGLFSGLKGNKGGDDIADTDDDPFKYTMEPYLDYAFAFKNVRNYDGGRLATLGPWLPKNFIDSIGGLRNKANPLRGRQTPSPGGAVPGFLRYHTADPLINGIGAVPAGQVGNPYLTTPDEFPAELLPFLPPQLVIPGTMTPGTFTLPGINNFVVLTEATEPLQDSKGTIPFGGDYSGIQPCVAPGVDPAFSTQLELGSQPGCLPFVNTRVTGGTGELPLRPAPSVSSVNLDWDPTVAQGLYIPSAGLIKYLNEGDFDSLDMNFRESERAWNRGASQQDLKELKEAYVDVEVLDSRLWMRLGLQQIVWGKTELFRTTDQFNPVDLALASIPSLEESRIALIAGRFIYSLYEVGPLEDVRLEFAFNFDQVQPADLGACGEAYTIDLVCSLSFGTWAHTYTGIGVAGVNRPASPWKDLGGLEIGGRIEWRWDRFSFAMVDFYGYDDIPSIESIMTFERNVDVDTGRPMVTRFNPGNARGTCATAAITDPRDLSSVSTAGMGTDKDCLKFGAPFADDPENALQFHHANQQIFAWVCSVTVGIAAGLDAGACFQTLFSSPELVDILEVPFAELMTVILAGEYPSNSYFGNIVAGVAPQANFNGVVPSQALNRDANDGFITAIHGTNMECTIPGVRRQGCDDAQTNSFSNQAPIGGNLISKLLPTDVDAFTLDSGLTNEQRALLGCGPFYGTRCDSATDFDAFDCGLTAGCRNTAFVRALFWDQVFPGNLQRGGGIDLLNAEGSALVQSWGGVEGTPEGYIATSMAAAPGTVNFEGGPVCTRFVPGSSTPVKLPGCRGIDSYEVNPTEVVFTFEVDYDPRVDGCLLAPSIGGRPVVTLRADGTDFTDSPEMASCFGNTALVAPGTGDFHPMGPATSTDRPCDSYNIANPTCLPEIAEFLDKRLSDSRRGDYQPSGVNSIVNFNHASTAYHPLAGCLTDAQIALQISIQPKKGPRCNPKPFIPGILEPGPNLCDGLQPPGSGCQDPRNFDAEFLAGTAQIFQNELAIVSWNFLQFLIMGSACDDTVDIETRADCFDPETPWALDKCSFNQAYYCSAVKGVLGITGVQRNVVKAGGNGTYGRRTLLWHGGQEVVLKYNKRNVFGMSMDFSEDNTKSNWGVEFTWFESVPLGNVNEFDGSHSVDTLNLTISADRPTFINFLNANRTFFFNTQWFFQYVAGHKSGSSGDQFSALFTFAMFTGYFQDRLNPSLVSIYDFNSGSGGVLTSVNYRFTEAFSATFGISLFYGKTELVDMGVNPIGPPTTRAGPNAYKNGTERFISNIRKRDEAFLRLRWTF
jgi:hypothetical protein